MANPMGRSSNLHKQLNSLKNGQPFGAFRKNSKSLGFRVSKICRFIILTNYKRRMKYDEGAHKI